jgi:hypothetical protein
LVEPEPKLNRETRDFREGRLRDVMPVLEQSVFSRIREYAGKVEVYGEKSLNLGPFITWIHRELNCRFVFLKRDGRAVVRSLMDWHQQAFGNIYREGRNATPLSPRAMEHVAGLPIHRDDADYSRPRPLRGSFEDAAWENYEREEMCAYYWSTVNRVYREELAKIPGDRWIELDYTSPTAEAVLQAADFCGLRGLSAERVDELLSRRINSVKERFQSADTYPSWDHWNARARQRFLAIAGPMMDALGYPGAPLGGMQC